jgi:L-ascorbate metabolism protein UlaG (beta-lactamase superfamily)
MGNFDGQRFHNALAAEKSGWDMLKLGLGLITESERWPQWRVIQAQRVPRDRVFEGISVTFINHATLLVQVNGLNILTDPVYGERASPFSWAGPRRIHEPGIRFEDLPPIDVVLISHNHYDHLDEETLRRLQIESSTPPLVLAGLGNSGLFEELGVSNYEDLKWGQGHTLQNVEFIFTECRHRSGRGLTDQMKTLWGSFVIRTPEGNIYFAGDTGYGPHLKKTGDDYGPFRLAMIPIGAYEPRWFMADIHLDPAEAVKAHQDLRSEQSLGIHYGTFQLTYEGVDKPLAELDAAASAAGLVRDEFWTLEVGETRVLTDAALMPGASGARDVRADSPAPLRAGTASPAGLQPGSP